MNTLPKNIDKYLNDDLSNNCREYILSTIRMSYNNEQEDVYIRGSCARNGKEGASSRAQVKIIEKYYDRYKVYTKWIGLTKITLNDKQFTINDISFL